MIKVKILKEAGYEEAMLGITLSHGATVERAKVVADKLAHKQGGHNKFLESIVVWLDVTAPRYWWSQADTYRISTKQSESTMHTILKRDLVHTDFAYELPEATLESLNNYRKAGNLEVLKALLPEGFMQRRIWMCSYKTLQNIIAQRNSHKLMEWRDFCDEIVGQVERPELIAQADLDKA